MGLEVKIIIHGVPAGQKLWGADDTQDEQYVETFYNQNEWDVPEFLKVDKVGKYVYYTFIKCGNVSAYDGRTGSYFGITLRLNACYTDVQNIYSILQATYSKLCVGLYVDDIGKKVKFRVQDFKQVDDKYKEYSQSVISAIGTFTTAKDLNYDLNGFPNSKGSVQCVSLSDCYDNIILKTLSSARCLKISRFYQSSKVVKLQEKYDEELKEIKRRHKDELEKTQKSCESNISKMQQSFNEKEQQLQNGSQKLKNEMTSLTHKLEKSEQEKARLSDKLRQEADDKQRIMSSLKEIVSKYSVEGTNQKHGQKVNKLESPMQVPCQPEKEEHKATDGRSVIKWSKKRIIGIIVIVVLIFSNALLWSQNISINKQLSIHGNELQQLTDTTKNSGEHATEAIPANDLSGNLRIDVKGLENGKYDHSKKLVVKLEGDTENQLHGKWASDELEIGDKNNKETEMWINGEPTSSEASIRYKVNGNTVIERVIQVF